MYQTKAKITHTNAMQIIGQQHVPCSSFGKHIVNLWTFIPKNTNREKRKLSTLRASELVNVFRTSSPWQKLWRPEGNFGLWRWDERASLGDRGQCGSQEVQSLKGHWHQQSDCFCCVKLLELTNAIDMSQFLASVSSRCPSSKQLGVNCGCAVLKHQLDAKKDMNSEIRCFCYIYIFIYIFKTFFLPRKTWSTAQWVLLVLRICNCGPGHAQVLSMI